MAGVVKHYSPGVVKHGAIRGGRWRVLMTGQRANLGRSVHFLEDRRVQRLWHLQACELRRKSSAAKLESQAWGAPVRVYTGRTWNMPTSLPEA